jgi:hypothetical protein
MQPLFKNVPHFILRIVVFFLLIELHIYAQTLRAHWHKQELPGDSATAQAIVPLLPTVVALIRSQVKSWGM